MHSGCRCSAIPARNYTQTWRMTLYTNASSSQNTSTSCIENSVVLRRLEFSSQLSETKLRDTCVKICSSMLNFTSTEFFLSYFSSHTPECVHQAFDKTEYIVISLRISWTFWNVFNSIIEQKSVDSLNKCTVLKKMFTPSKYFMSLTICAEYFVIDWNFSYIEDTSCIHGLSSDFQIVLSNSIYGRIGFLLTYRYLFTLKMSYKKIIHNPFQRVQYLLQCLPFSDLHE